MTLICFFALLVFSAIAFLIYKKSNGIKAFNKRVALAILAIIIFCIGLEVSIFNINHYTTKNYEATDLSHFLGETADHNGEYTLLGNKEIEFPEINTEIENIKIVLGNDAPPAVNVTVYLTDEANEYYFGTPSRTIYKDVNKSNYIAVAASGASTHLKLRFDCEEYVLKVKSVSINEKRDFDFSFVRLGILTAILLLLYIFRPSSPLYKTKLTEAKDSKSSFIAGFMAVQCVIFMIIGTLNPLFLGWSNYENGLKFEPLRMENHNQYDELAQAFLQGKTYIDNNDIPESLLNMENPYDTTARSLNAQLTGDHYRWDVAFYNGHYYVYFGIVPLLLMYLPFRAIFDAPFPSAFGIIGFATIFALGVFKLLQIIAEKRFKNLSIGVYLLTALGLINCCGTMFLVKRPDFYSVPIICAMSFVVWGIYWWIKGRDSEKKQNIYLFIGSLCCALAVGCRPQSVLMCAVALPLFWEFLFKNKKIATSKGIKNLIVLGLPFIVVASGIMYYNFIRFGSPFDFGSGYNLTTNDVTRRGFEIGRTGLGIFTYLFQTPNFTATFPFIENVSIQTNYVGKTIYEYCFGGLITCTPVLWFIAALPKAKGSLKKHKLFGFTIITLLVGLATVIADAQAGGLLQRYFSDFGYIFFIATAIIIFAIFNNVNTEETNKIFTSLLFISTIFSIVYTFCLVFSVADVTIDTKNPATYGYIKHLVEFWL